MSDNSVGRYLLEGKCSKKNFSCLLRLQFSTQKLRKGFHRILVAWGGVLFYILSNDWLLDATCGSIMAVKLVKCNMTLYCYFIGIAFTALLPKYGPGQPSLDKVLVAQFCKHLVDVLHFAVCVKNPSTSNIFCTFDAFKCKGFTIKADLYASRSYVVIHRFFSV